MFKIGTTELRDVNKSHTIEKELNEVERSSRALNGVLTYKERV